MERSSKRGTRTSKGTDLRASDPLDQLIFEKGLRISEVDVVANGTALVVRLNNGSVFAESVAVLPSLARAAPKELKQCEVFAGGVGIAWPRLDVHLSLKGFLTNMVRNELIRRFTMEPAAPATGTKRRKSRVSA
jgi:hypothetical protein